MTNWQKVILFGLAAALIAALAILKILPSEMTYGFVGSLFGYLAGLFTPVPQKKDGGES